MSRKKEGQAQKLKNTNVHYHIQMWLAHSRGQKENSKIRSHYMYTLLATMAFQFNKTRHNLHSISPLNCPSLGVSCRVASAKSYLGPVRRPALGQLFLGTAAVKCVRCSLFRSSY